MRPHPVLPARARPDPHGGAAQLTADSLGRAEGRRHLEDFTGSEELFHLGPQPLHLGPQPPELRGLLRRGARLLPAVGLSPAHPFAAGYAPLHSSASLSSPLLKRVEQALTSMLDQHEPFPAVVLDRGWQVQRASNGAQRLVGRLFAPYPVPAPANVLRLVIESGPMRDQLGNWAAVVPALLDRAHREAIGGVLDRETAELVRNLRSRPDVARLLTEPDPSPGTAPIVDLHFDMAGTSLRFFSVVSTIGAPIDFTAQELRVEASFPADDQTRDRWRSFVVNERASSRLTTSNWSKFDGERGV